MDNGNRYTATGRLDCHSRSRQIAFNVCAVRWMGTYLDPTILAHLTCCARLSSVDHVNDCVVEYDLAVLMKQTTAATRLIGSVCPWTPEEPVRINLSSNGGIASSTVANVHSQVIGHQLRIVCTLCSVRSF